MATVLIIEDEAMVLILAESVLQKAGHETLSAGLLPEGKAIIESDAKFDIVFTDITLGEEQDAGIAIGKLVENKRSGTPVLYTSARALTDGLQVLLVEHSAFLPKPYTDKSSERSACRAAQELKPLHLASSFMFKLRYPIAAANR
jgi:CheY-like chemotaxis protein